MSENCLDLLANVLIGNVIGAAVKGGNDPKRMETHLELHVSALAENSSAKDLAALVMFLAAKWAEDVSEEKLLAACPQDVRAELRKML